MPKKQKVASVKKRSKKGGEGEDKPEVCPIEIGRMMSYIHNIRKISNPEITDQVDEVDKQNVRDLINTIITEKNNTNDDETATNNIVTFLVTKYIKETEETEETEENNNKILNELIKIIELLPNYFNKYSDKDAENIQGGKKIKKIIKNKGGDLKDYTDKELKLQQIKSGLAIALKAIPSVLLEIVSLGFGDNICANDLENLKYSRILNIPGLDPNIRKEIHRFLVSFSYATKRDPYLKFISINKDKKYIEIERIYNSSYNYIYIPFSYFEYITPSMGFPNIYYPLIYKYNDENLDVNLNKFTEYIKENKDAIIKKYTETLRDTFINYISTVWEPKYPSSSGGSRKSLNKCTCAELKEKCKTRKIKGYSTMNKDQLIAALRRKK